MTTISIVYHSGYGHTANQAKAILDGIKTIDGVDASLIPIDEHGDINETEWQMLDASDAIIFGSPTYMGMASWQFKKFADATSKRWFNQDWKESMWSEKTLRKIKR